MTLFKSRFSRLSRKPAPVVAANQSLDSWCRKYSTQSAQFVQRVEMCTAPCVGNDGWDMPLGKNHYHTLLRVFLHPIRTGRDAGDSEDILLIERVLSTSGAFHAVTPISEMLSTGGTLLHPNVHDRLCAIQDGPSTTLVRDLVVERTLTFDDWTLTLAQLAKILGLVSQTTEVVCDGGDCQFQSRSFVFTCLAAMAPTIPEMASVHRGSQLVDDSVFELISEAFLTQISWLVRDPAMTETLELIGSLKEGPRGRTRVRLYH